MRPASVSAVLALVGVAALAAALVAFGTSPTPDGALTVAGIVVLAIPAAALSVVLTRHRPADRLAPLLMAIAVTPAVVAVGDLAPVWIGAGPAWLDPVLDNLDQALWRLWYLPLALLLILFPTGRPPRPWWRWLVGALVAVTVVAGAGQIAHDAGLLPSGLGVVDLVLTLGLLPLLVAALAAPVARYRGAGETQRRKLRWLALVGMTVPGTLLLCWAGYVLFQEPTLAVIGLFVTYLALPAGTGIALLDDELWDVDRALAATVAHVALTGALLALFSGVTLAAGAIAADRSAVPAVLAAAVTAAVFLPLRARLQRVADRFVYPARAVAVGAVEALQRRTGEDEALPEDLTEVLRSALHDPDLRIGLRFPGAGGLVGVDGESLDPGEHAVAVTLAGAEIGMLVPGSRRSRHLLREVAAASAPLVELVRLRLELRQALVSVEESRARLLSVSYEERRRLERDLHDGAQQRLVSLGMALRLAQRHLTPVLAGDGDGRGAGVRAAARAPVDVDAVLDGAVAELATAVAELRQVAHGIRPSCLDDGLPAALATLAETVPVDVRLNVDLDGALDGTAGRLPPDVETTAYFVASEAVTNAVKHAAAGRIDLSLTRDGDGVLLVVADDGCGGARSDGGGLSGLDDRVRAHGGTLRVHSPAGDGTRVEALLPCVS